MGGIQRLLPGGDGDEITFWRKLVEQARDIPGWAEAKQGVKKWPVAG